MAAATDANLYGQQAIAARFLYRLGRFEEAMALALYVVNRDPACAVCVTFASGLFRLTGEHRQGAERLEKLLEWSEGSPFLFWHLGVGWLGAGDPANALEYFEQASPGIRAIGRLLALHDLGCFEEFEAEFSELRGVSEAHPESIARIAAWTGQNDLAFEYLESAVALEGPGLVESVKRGHPERAGTLLTMGRTTSNAIWGLLVTRFSTSR